MVTLGVYLLFTVATAFAWNFASFAAFRVLAGSGIGGEYAAINSAIDELIPARVRGRVALAINGSWWVGAVGSALASYALLNWMSTSIGWRLGFGIGATLALCILAIRRFIPERAPAGCSPTGAPIEVEQRENIGFVSIAKYVVEEYPAAACSGCRS